MSFGDPNRNQIAAPTQRPARKRVTSADNDRLFNSHGVDRTVQGMHLFGRNWLDMQPYYGEADETPLPTPRPIPRNLIDLVGAP